MLKTGLATGNKQEKLRGAVTCGAIGILAGDPHSKVTAVVRNVGDGKRPIRADLDSSVLNGGGAVLV
jgi:hypothetical protein